jgi:predicted TIM-barrel fold metal-dependent hydrolase
MRLLSALGFLYATATFLPEGQTTPLEPVIDMHLHALPANYQGPPPVFICAPFSQWPTWDPATSATSYETLMNSKSACANPLRSAQTDQQLMNETLQILKKRNIIGLASGPLPTVELWKRAGGELILPATWFFTKSGPSPDELRKLVASKRIVAFAELQQQYEGMSLDDPAMEPYYSLAEELDVPVGIHMGPGPPGVAYYALPGYRMKLSSMLNLENILVRHPKLRVWAMHAGWPLLDDAVGALYAHPQLYVDVGVISFVLPKAEFYLYLKRLVDAGFENRIMFGSDQMLWPDAILIAIETIEQAPFLSREQKRDILYNNAARFLRLKR